MRRRSVLLFVLSGLLPVEAAGQESARVLRLGPVEARSAAEFTRIQSVRQLSDGSVLVAHGDGVVTWMDSTLTSVFEAVAGSPGYGGERGRALIRWHADSTLVADPRARLLYVLDAQGNLAREIDIPSPQVAVCLSGRAAMPALDAGGRILCQLAPDTRARDTPPPGMFTGSEVSDTSALVRVSLDSWAVDTIAFVGSGRTIMALSDMGDGQYALGPLIDPLPVVDDWAVTANGRIGVVRGSSYRLDWLDAAGAITSSRALPWERVALDAARKSAILDSARSALELARYATQPGTFGRTTRPPVRDTIPQSSIRALTIVLPGMARDPEAMARMRSREPAPLQFVAAEDLPDVVPPFRPGGVRADLDGNLWIRTSQSGPDGVLHHVVAASGGPLAILTIPAAGTIAGFGSGGVVYLSVAENGRFRLERRRVAG